MFDAYNKVKEMWRMENNLKNYLYEIRCIEWYVWNDWLKQDVNIRAHKTLSLVQDTQHEMNRTESK